jgi:AcrR family transcriptional regulator
MAMPTDATSADQATTLIGRTVGELGRVDVLVNGAGRAMAKPVELIDLEEYRDVLELNVVAPPVPERSATPLARDRIIDTTEAVLRRHGLAKSTVLDVSRALGVSHDTVYRHFPSKAALVEAVTERWLAQVIAPLAAIAQGPGPALPRMRGWFDALSTTKRQLASDDPEMFDTYVELMEQAPEMVQRHTGALLEQLTDIVASVWPTCSRSSRRRF